VCTVAYPVLHARAQFIVLCPIQLVQLLRDIGSKNTDLAPVRKLNLNLHNYAAQRDAVIACSFFFTTVVTPRAIEIGYCT
jgi:hypothetical protein